MGSGLPICCISGLAVAEAGRGSGRRAPGGSHKSPNFLGTIIGFFVFDKVALDVGDMTGKNIYIYIFSHCDDDPILMIKLYVNSEN